MSIEAFRRELRSSVRGLWMGVIDSDQFSVAMQASIARRITQAWAEGAAEAGITPDEYSPEENAALTQFMANQYSYIGDFAAYIIERGKANGGALEPLMSRVETWANRYEEARIKGRTMAMADQKLVWRLGPTKDHCGSCSSLDGKVKRGKYWVDHAILPRSKSLECRGFRCLCTLDPTRLPISPGPLPKFM